MTNQTSAVVVGAGGQTGASVLARLSAEPSIRAWGVVRNELTAGPLRRLGMSIRVGDARRDVGVLEGADVVINLASASGLGGSARIEDRGLVDAILATPSVRRLVQLSSVAVYGRCVVSRNGSFASPRSDFPFGRDKLNLERYVARAAARSGKDAVLVRMGHVYGPEQWVSKYVFDARCRAGFGLPFDGRRPSNAVHVQHVSAALMSAVQSDIPAGTYNLFESPQKSWREIFDWHTEAIGAARVPGMDERSASRFDAMLRAQTSTHPAVRIARELGGWAKGLPVQVIAASPSLRYTGLSMLSVLQSPRLEAEILKRYSVASIAAKVRTDEPYSDADSVLFSDAAPGPSLPVPNELSEKDRRLLAQWHAGYSDPEAVFHSAPQVLA